MNKKYNIVFYGKINLGWNIEVVKKNLSRLVKKDRQNIDSLFSGKPIVLKKKIALQTADRFKTFFEKTGALCEIQEVYEKTDLNHLTMEEHTSDKTVIEKPPEQLIICPQCGFQQLPSQECRQCAIIFSKFFEKDKAEEQAQKAPPQISKEMEQAAAKAKMIAMMGSMKNKKRYDLRKILKMTRIGLLLLTLLGVAIYTTCTNSRIAGWGETLEVVIYPINGDQSEQTEGLISTLDEENFRPVETFMMEEAERYEFGLEKPVRIHLAPEIKSLPPEPPQNRSPLVVILWSLKMRYWAFRHNTYENSLDIRVYVIYTTKESADSQMEVSVGLRKGLMGIVNTSPDIKAQDYTNIIITHEMLHTLGAKDKYDYATLMPNHPDGYADPEKNPLYPQPHGEIMAVRIPKSPNSFSMPKSLDNIVIGEKTCMEIKWCKEAGS
jgi:hypothetical protein